VKENQVIAVEKAPTRFNEDLSAYSFQKFAATYFMSNVSYQFSKRPLKNSLLNIPVNLQVAAQALWITILRFMGDIGEAKYENEIDDEQNSSRHNVMQKFAETLGRKSAITKEFKGFLKTEHPEQKLIHATLRNKNKLSREFMRMVQNNDDLQKYQEWISSRSSHIDKLHFIIGHGILREELRDEIYCQICKQLSNNPNSISFKKGWILLALCVGCFSPSENFELYLRQFIRSGPELYAPFCEGKLNRLMKNGLRKQPPSWHELKSSKTKEPIIVNVNLMNDTSLQLEIDSASTSEEICIAIAKSIDLKDLLGFSLFITISNKVMTLGCEHQFVFDAISRCEQFAKEQGITEKAVRWQLFLQKEMFLPWHNPEDDPIATELIYHQIIKGIHFGDYVCTSEKDIAMISALRYYAEVDGPYEKGKMIEKLVEYLPKSIYRKETVAQWEALISNAYNKCRCVKEKLAKISAKEDIVYFAKITWTLKFSRFFEVLKVDDNTADVFIIGINWTGVYLIDNQEQVLVSKINLKIYCMIF
jgi:myosin-7